jgi:mannose-6-phosphate isomerase class I
MHDAGVLELHGVVQHYDWGGHDFIPSLLGCGPQKRDQAVESDGWP